MSKNQYTIRKPHWVEALGLEVKKSQKYCLKPEQVKLLTDLRVSEKMGIPLEKVSKFSNSPYYWDKSKEHSFFVKNPLFKEEHKDEFAKNLIEELKDYSPKYPKIKREKVKDGHLLVIDPADIHIGKLCTAFESGEDYNNQIAVQRVKEGVEGILSKSNGFNIEKIMFVGGNDILHIDTPKRQTTSGTPQDTDGMWYSNFLIAKKTIRWNPWNANNGCWRSFCLQPK